jgi:hypothetical protein
MSVPTLDGPRQRDVEGVWRESRRRSGEPRWLLDGNESPPMQGVHDGHDLSLSLWRRLLFRICSGTG